MNSKEALEILNIAWSGRKDKDGYPNFDDIHMALYTLDKNLERLEKFAHENASLHTEIESLHTENAKLKKVIEILTTKDIYIGVLNRSNNSSEYNNYMSTFFDYNFWNMSQEDFELLKEYL